MFLYAIVIEYIYRNIVLLFFIRTFFHNRMIVL